MADALRAQLRERVAIAPFGRERRKAMRVALKYLYKDDDLVARIKGLPAQPADAPRNPRLDAILAQLAAAASPPPGCSHSSSLTRVRRGHASGPGNTEASAHRHRTKAQGGGLVRSSWPAEGKGRYPSFPSPTSSRVLLPRAW